MSSNSPEWIKHPITRNGTNSPLTVFTFEKPAKLGFINPETGSHYEGPVNGDAVRHYLHQRNQRLRIVVVDGVSGSEQLDLPDGYTSPAIYAKDCAIETIPQAKDLTETLLEINTKLHDPIKGVLSPNVCVSVADTELTESGITAEFLRAGDCEIYGYRTIGGWFQILDEDMLTDTGRLQFENLKVELLPEINKVRTEVGMNSPAFKKLFAAFQRREEEILGNQTNWRSLPIGRYDTAKLKSRGFMTAKEAELEAILLTSDGPHISDRQPFTEVLNEHGRPSNIPSTFFESRREGWNDIAAAMVIAGR